MHPRTTELLEYLDAQYEVLRSSYNSVPPAQRARRPSPTQWSANDTVTHLAIMERRLANLFGTLLSEERRRGLRAETDSSPIMASIDLEPVLDRSRKIVAPERVDPRQTGDALEWSDYEAARLSIRGVLLANDGLALGDLTHPHPVFGPLNLYVWFAFIGAHAARHAAQIREASEFADQAAVSPTT